MLTANDEKQLKKRGISQEQIQTQLTHFKNGFPFLNILHAATPQRGITVLSESEMKSAVQFAESYRGNICKFVPASGAASRMFKDLFEAVAILQSGKQLDEQSPAKEFLNNVTSFPFFDDLGILTLTLFSKGLNYGETPKGLIAFHKYEHENRTPFEEHLVEGAQYAKKQNGDVKMVITVSPEHMEGFKELFLAVKEKYEKRYHCRYDVEFTTQSPSTDIIAVDEQNEPFRKENGEILFRPGGHGALLQNLNAIESDIIIIKNIDNVIKESLLGETIRWKKILIGRAALLQESAALFMKELDEYAHVSDIPDSRINEIKAFLEIEFCVTIPSDMDKMSTVWMLKEKLNRPVRVCGMVKNEGEPGGGPFIIKHPDNTTSLQILESAQIDPSNPTSVSVVKNSTHFNPVDLVCAVKDYKGNKFDLMKYSDPSTGFISSKSYEGRKLKAQELPGLWNGAMSNWNTQFIEVPLITFNPVKTVLDLLRKEHQVD